MGKAELEKKAFAHWKISKNYRFGKK